MLIENNVSCFSSSLIFIRQLLVYGAGSEMSLQKKTIIKEPTA